MMKRLLNLLCYCNIFLFIKYSRRLLHKYIWKECIMVFQNLSSCVKEDLCMMGEVKLQAPRTGFFIQLYFSKRSKMSLLYSFRFIHSNYNINFSDPAAIVLQQQSPVEVKIEFPYLRSIKTSFFKCSILQTFTTIAPNLLDKFPIKVSYYLEIQKTWTEHKIKQRLIATLSVWSWTYNSMMVAIWNEKTIIGKVCAKFPRKL